MATMIIDHRASRPRLPFDVQLMVAENCPDVPTFLALVSSHRTLRQHGARLALQLPTARVRLRTELTLHSFICFVAAPLARMEGLPSRLTHLHTLDVSLVMFGSASVKALTAMLRHVPELSSLTLHEPEVVLASSTALYTALQRLTTLKSLHAFGMGPATRKLFREVASSLENVTLVEGQIVRLDDVRRLELDTVLGPHRDTLRRVRASRATPFTGVGPGAEMAVFENVRELVIDDFVWDTAPNFLDAFPNVVSLDMGTAITAHFKLSPVMLRVREENRAINGGDEYDDGDDSDTEGFVGEEEERDDVRNSGDSDSEMEERDEVDALLEVDEGGQMGEQNEIGTHPQADAGGNDEGEADDEESLVWESLKHVRGGLLDLYVFGNSCEVDVLTIDGLVHDAWAWACVPAVVHDHLPRTLRLGVSSSLDAEAWEMGWKNLASVRGLELKIVAEDLFDEEQLMDTVARAVGSFISCRQVCLNLAGQNEATCHRLNSFDHKEFACRVFERSRRPTALQICVHTPSGKATIWNYDPPVGFTEEDDAMEVRPVLS